MLIPIRSICDKIRTALIKDDFKPGDVVYYQTAGGSIYEIEILKICDKDWYDIKFLRIKRLNTFSFFESGKEYYDVYINKKNLIKSF